MRQAIAACLAIAFLSGCAAPSPPATSSAKPPVVACDESPATTFTFYPDDAYSLRANGSAAGVVPIHGFQDAFLDDSLPTWVSAPLETGLRVEGNVTVDLFVLDLGTPAPAPGGPPGSTTHLYVQFGTNATFMPAFASITGPVAPDTGQPHEYNVTLQVPRGGFVAEAGERLRLLVGSLAIDLPTSRGEALLVGAGTPTHVTFAARCFEAQSWFPEQDLKKLVMLPGNEGLFTHLVPAQSGANVADFPFTVINSTARLTIALRSDGAMHPGKDDMDIELLDASGTVVWTAATPFSNETLRMWKPNLDALLPPGSQATTRVHSYSGVNYVGRLEITFDSAETHDDPLAPHETGLG
jgi:hypothetical protein